MSTEQQRPGTRDPAPTATDPGSDALATGQAAERADFEEDRRRQRELDEGEMGGES